MPPYRSIVLSVLAFALAAAPACAAQFYVDDNGPGPATPGCQDSGHPCTTVGAALTASRALAGTGDTINLAAGTYNEDVVVDQPQDNGLTIDGAGQALGGSLISHVSNASQTLQLGAQSAPLNTGITLKDVAVSVPAGSDPSKSGIVDAVVGSTLDHVTVTVSDSASMGTGLAVSAGSGATTLNHIAVLSAGGTQGVAIVGAATTTMTHSGVAMTNSSAANAYALVTVDASVHVVSSRIKVPPASPASALVIATGSTGVIDSSLVLGGSRAIWVSQGSAATSQATVRRSTVDAATPGVDDAGSTGTSIYAETKTAAGAVATVNVTQSLLVDVPGAHAVSGLGTASVTCDTTITPVNALFTNVNCGAAGGNSTAAPSALFVDAPGLDYDLKPGSPAVAAGSGSGLAAGEPTDDEAGQARLVDGNLDCVARPDLGALELQGQSNTAPTVSADGPATATAGQAVSFSATGADAEDGPGALTYAWTTSDGGSGSGAAFQHAFGAGDQSATVTVTDSHGCTASATRSVTVAAADPGPGTADTTPPVLSGVSVSKHRLRFTLSEAAAVHVAFARRRCKRVHGKRRCRMRTVHNQSIAGAAGSNASALPKLPRATYRLTLVARDAAGNASKPQRLRVRIRP